MRTTVRVDDELMKTAVALSGLKTKKNVIEAGLRLLVQVSRQGSIRDYRGRLSWTDDVSRTRTDA